MDSLQLNEELSQTREYQRAYKQALSECGSEREDSSVVDPPPTVSKVESFPVEVFSLPFQRLMLKGAEALHCPLDFLGVPLLALAGAAIGDSRVIEIKRGWQERPVIFAAVIALPGSKKSPALNLVSRPFRRRQQKLYAKYLEEKASYEEKLAKYEVELAVWKREAAKGKADPGEKPKVPSEPRLRQIYTTDTTLEALAELQLYNPSLAVICDELTAWVRSFNQYKGGKGADRQAWLSFWSGAPAMINRKGRKEPIVLDRPFVPVIGCLPPDVLCDLTDERGREAGFIHRVLCSFPDPLPGQWTDGDLAPEVMNEIEDVLTNLWELEPGKDQNGTIHPVVLQFTASAKSLWVEWITKHYAEQVQESFPDHLRGPWAKLEGYYARFALILHLCRCTAREVDSEEIDEESTAGAWALVHYFKSHARQVYAHLRTTPQDRRALQIVEWIKTHNNKTSARDLLNYKVAGIRTSSEARKLLLDLVDRGHGTVSRSGKREIFSLSA